MTTKPGPKAPAGLGRSGLALWRSITTWQLDDLPLVLRPDETAILVIACHVADTITMLEADVKGEPRVTIGAGGVERVDPLIRELRSQRGQLAGLLARLDLPEANADNEWEGLTLSQRGRKAVRARWGA
jgi:hypothetical protein